jgi:hypothetical protein
MMTAGASGSGASSGAGGSGGTSSADAAGGSAGSSGGTAGSGGTGAEMDAMVDVVDDEPVDCASRPDVDGYRPNLTKIGRNGVLTFVLVESTPAPPRTGTNVWTFKVARSGASPVTEGLSAVLDMPEHTHSVNIQPEIVFDATLGAFKLDPIYAYLTGLWRLTFEVKDGPDGGETAVDSVVFTFCI